LAIDCRNTRTGVFAEAVTTREDWSGKNGRYRAQKNDRIEPAEADGKENMNRATATFRGALERFR
jgi:hypothetical protein